MNRLLVLCAAAAFCIGSNPADALAQAGTGGIVRGTVVDSAAGRPLAGARRQIPSQTIEAARSRITKRTPQVSVGAMVARCGWEDKRAPPSPGPEASFSAPSSLVRRRVTACLAATAKLRRRPHPGRPLAGVR